MDSQELKKWIEDKRNTVAHSAEQWARVSPGCQLHASDIGKCEAYNRVLDKLKEPKLSITSGATTDKYDVHFTCYGTPNDPDKILEWLKSHTLLIDFSITRRIERPYSIGEWNLGYHYQG